MFYHRLGKNSKNKSKSNDLAFYSLDKLNTIAFIGEVVALHPLTTISVKLLFDRWVEHLSETNTDTACRQY